MLPNNYVIVVERTLRRVSFIDADTLMVAGRLEVPGDLMDVAVTSDFHKAVVSAFLTQQLFEIDLLASPPAVVHTAAAPNALEDVALTPDNRFAVSVDGQSTVQQFMVSYGLDNQAVGLAAADAQAVAASPSLHGRLMAARYGAGRVRLFLIDEQGALTDTGSESTAGGSPINLAFTNDGQYCFVADYFGSQIVVLATGNPAYFGETSRAAVAGFPQTVIVSRTGNRVYVLTTEEVATFDFNPISQRLTLVSRFNHNQTIVSYFGVERMTLDRTETRLFISGDQQLAVFALDGSLLGIVPNVLADGGVASGRAVLRLPANTLLAASTAGRLLFLDENLEPVIDSIETGDSFNPVPTPDCSRAVMAFPDNTLKDIDLTTIPPSVEYYVYSPVPLLGLSTTPDSRYAVGVSAQAGGRMVSYAFGDQTRRSIAADVQSVAVSPNGSGSILATRYFEGRVRRYRIDAAGALTDTGGEAAVQDSPVNLAFSPDGDFAFVANYGTAEIVVLDTSHPDYFGEASRVGTDASPQTLVVSRDGRRVYALTLSSVQIFGFDPVAKTLTPVGGFAHNLLPIFITGVNQMAVNAQEDRVFVLSFEEPGSLMLSAFDMTGGLLHTRRGLRPGISICM